MADETIRDVVVRIRIDVEDAKIRAPETSAASKSVDDFRRQANAATSEISGGFVEVSDTAETMGVKIQEAGLRTGEGLKQAGEGAFTLARGIAFLSSSSEEDFRKMVQNVAQVQGAFDVFKGGVDTIKGITEAAPGVVAAFGQLAVAFGPVGLAITGVTVAVGALVAAWQFFDDAPDDVESTVDKVRELKQALAETREEARFDLIARSIGTTAGISSQLLATLEGSEARSNFLGRQQRSLQGQASALRRERLTGPVIRNTDDALAAARVEDPLGSSADQQARAAELLEQSIQRSRAEAAVRQELVRVEQRIAAERQRIADTHVKSLEAQRESLRVAKEQVDVEKGRNRTLREIVGGLSSAEFAELQGFASKRGRGETLTREEAARASQLLQGAGGSRELLAGIDVERGRERGALGVVGDITGREFTGPGSALDDARRRLADIQGVLGEARDTEEEISREIERFTRERQRQAEQQIRILQETIQHLGREQRRLDRLENELQVMQQTGS